MKKRFMSLLTVAATLATGFTSCSNDESVIPDHSQKQTVSLKVDAGKPASRAEEAAETGTAPIDITLGGAVYFLNGGVVTDYFPIVPDGSAGTDDIKTSELQNGVTKTFTNVSGSATDVYVLLNVPASMLTGVDALPGAGSTLTDINGSSMKIINFTDVKKVMIKGMGAITAGVAGANATAAVSAAPVVARFEIGKVVYDEPNVNNTANPLVSFDLAGIFVNNHHKTMPLDFTPGTPLSSTAATDYVDNSTFFPAPLSGITGTYAASNTNAFTCAPAPATPVWAYQFFPVDAANTKGDMPMLVLKLTNVVATNPGVFDPIQYVSINKFKDASGAVITKFEANHIYKISDITFTNKNLNPNPAVTLIDVDVTVTVSAWIPEEITPVL